MTQIKQYIKGRLYNLVLPVVIALLGMTFFLPGLHAQARQTPFTVYGNVTDAKMVPIMGAIVRLQEYTRFAETDELGNFEIEVPGSNSILTVEAAGFATQTVTVTGAELHIQMAEAIAGQEAKDRIYLPWAISDRRSITSAVGTISHQELRQSPVMSLSQALSGRIPGFTVMQTTGGPGWSSENWRIRGTRTLEAGGNNNMAKGGSGAPIAVVDGFERTFTDFDASEIESFSILKDAAATAIYGLRGANGVIFITTRRGQENKRTIDFEASTGIVTPTRLPEYLGSYDYARLFNEARKNDGLSEPYTTEALDAYKDHSRPLRYPDNDYYAEFLNDFATMQKAALTLSGGNKLARYFIALSYNTENGLYARRDENPDFKVPSNYRRFNTRTNLDIIITKRLTAVVNIAGRLEFRNSPYTAESTIWSLISNLPPNAFPLSFMGVDPALNQKVFMLGGTSLFQSNPLGELSFRGYTNGMRRYYQMGVGFNYDLSFVTPGLTAGLMLDRDGYSLYNIGRYVTYRSWEYRENTAGEPIAPIPYKTPTTLTTGASWDYGAWSGYSFNLKYDKTFGESSVHALAMMRRFKTIRLEANQPDLKNEDWILRVNYSLKNKYFIEGLANYTSNDNIFLTNIPRIFLPAISAGWILSEEDFLSGDLFSFLKLRGSFGLTGNDWYTYADPNGLRYRFPYRDRYWTRAAAMTYWGVTLVAGSTYTAYQGVIPNKDFTAEKGRVGNIGLDIRMLSDRLTLSTDLWFEKRYDIYTNGEGSIPQAFGTLVAYLPIMNQGIVNSKGFELDLGWNDKIGKVEYWVNGLFDMSKNKIKYMAEPLRDYPYLTETGGPVLQDWGLVALGLFKDQADIDNSPVQTFGKYQPGDIKYKDLNDDGKIDQNDYQAIGKGRWPTVSYAMDMGFRLGQFDFSMFWQGSTQYSKYLSYNYYRPFNSNGSASVYALGRYTDAASWEKATAPRLTTVASDNNHRISTYWLKDLWYLRLRNFEIGYNFTSLRVKKLGLYGARAYINAYNFLTFDNLKILDPEDPSAGITSYPMNRTTNLGIILKF